MSEEPVEHDHDVPAEEVEEEINPNLVEASAWRLGPGGSLAAVNEWQVGWLAQQEPMSIYFYCELEGSNHELTHNDETMQKVFQALSAQGLNEGQIIGAVNAMQNAGIYFREPANV